MLAIDQGTTSTKSFTLNSDGRFTPLHAVSHQQIYPEPGWVEHDPLELLGSIRQCIEALGAMDAASEVVAMGLDNQGETVIAWNAESGEPVYNAIVWQDTRTQDAIDRLQAEGAEELTLQRAGLPLDPYYSATKLRWLIDLPEARSLAQQNKLHLGTSETYFLERLTGIYATDVTTASRTCLMNLATCQWDEELCKLFGIPMDMLPEIKPTTSDFGTVNSEIGPLAVTASVVDQQAALFGQRCHLPGQTKFTFGTGAFALANAGSQLPSVSQTGVLPTLAWQLGSTPPIYAVDGAVFTAASAVNWIKGLGLFQDTEEINQFKNSSALSRGLAFVPALTGLASPYWDRSAAGLWLGMGLDTTRADLCQSVLEGIAMRAADIVEALTPLVGADQKLSVDGGLTNNRYFCQFLADVTEREIHIPGSTELTCLGTAYLAMIGSGLASDTNALPPEPPPKAIINPRQSLANLRERFSEAVTRSQGWR